jgi:glyoxylase-like metal-dependent hydrolase (beta-lactamase superfamily II)
MELYAIRYGVSLFRYKNIYQDMFTSKEVIEFLWLYYLAKYNDKVILFDTGFRDKSVAKKWEVELINIGQEIRNIIDDLNCVDTVFITHSHFDHIENLDLFEKSLIIISKTEYDIAIKKCSKPVKRRLKKNSIVTVKDEYLFDNKFIFKVVGGHSIGSSVVYFSENEKDYVITGDECYVCDNMLSERPIGSFNNLLKNMEFLSDSRIKGLIPLPCHDVKIFENHTKVSENIVRII